MNDTFQSAAYDWLLTFHNNQGYAAGQNFLAPPYYRQRTVCVSLSTFFIIIIIIIIIIYYDIVD